MDVFETIKLRRSIRAFGRKPISSAVLYNLLEAARCAPSAGNIQPWEIVIVRKSEIKAKIGEAALGQSFLEQAPIVLVICADTKRSTARYGSRGETLYCIQDTAAAIQNMNLLACSLGLGTCWIGSFDEDMVRRILEIPGEIRPLAIVPVGYAAESPSARRRRPISEFVHEGMY